MVVEYKLQHTPLAWWQTRQKYLPVLSQIFPLDLWEFAAVEVVQWFDPHTPFPEPIDMLEDVISASPQKFGVHIWSGRGHGRR